MTGQDIIDTARQCLKTPFVHQGRIPGIALDCAGLVVVTADQLGIPIIDRLDYSRLPNNGSLEAALDIQPALKKVSREDVQISDVLLMRFKSEPQHLGLYAGQTIIHTWQPVGCVCEHDLDAAWRRRIVAVYRFVGVTHG